MPLQKPVDRHLEREERGLRTRVRQRRDQRVHAPLAPGDLRPRRHLRPIQLQHLPRPIAGPLRRPHRPQAQLAQPTAHDTDRGHVAVLARHSRRSRRLDLRPFLEQAPQHRLEPIELRPHPSPPITRRLTARQQPRDRTPVDPQPLRDLPLRQPVRRQRPHPRPLQRAQHLPTSSPRPDPSGRACEPSRSDQNQGEWCTFRCPIPVQYWAPRVRGSCTNTNARPDGVCASTGHPKVGGSEWLPRPHQGRGCVPTRSSCEGLNRSLLPCK
jgi:hypothetical protein